MSVWIAAIVIYVVLALTTLLPTIRALLKRVELLPGGSGFEDSPHFSDNAKMLLHQHYSRIQGTLLFWKNQAELYRSFHYYALSWSIVSSTLLPVFAQTVTEDPYSKLFLTIVSTHVALVLAFHRGFKVDKNFQSFRHGESEFYDLRRRLLDRPAVFGRTEEKQIERYFVEVETVRQFIRNAETDNFPMFENVNPQPSQSRSEQSTTDVGDTK